MRADHDALARLEEERAFLLTSLDDLERERAAGDLGDDDYATLRDGYTARAADVLRAIEAGRGALPPRRSRPLGRTLGVIAVVLVAAGLAGWFVARGAGTRLEGETVTGGDAADTVNENLALARSLSNREPLEAIEAFDRVLEVDGDNAEALTYRGWLLVLVGQSGQRPELVERGEAGIDDAIAADATYADAQCFKAIVRFSIAGDADGARAPVEACLAADPPPEVRSLVEGLAAEIAAA